MSSRPNTTRVFALFLGLSLFLSSPLRGQEPPPVVHAILFYSPACPHCHEVINNFLIPLQDEYGSRLVILGFDSTQPWANELFWAALRHYEVPEDKWAVPFMIVDDQVLVGGFEIPDQLPDILKEGLANGGIDLPDFPGLMTFMEEEGLLDHRYPERRIALQDPQEGPEPGAGGEEHPPEAPVAEDSAAAVRPQPAHPEGEGREPAGEEDDTTSLVAGAVADSVADTAPDTVADTWGGPAAAPVVDTGADTTARADSAPVATPPEARPAGPRSLADAARQMESMSMMDRFNQDPAGGTLAVVVLLGMLVSVLLRGFPPRARGKPWPVWIIPALVVLGVGVASYLSYIEVTHAEAVCGPVGDCNTVNQSRYATLFGVLPVGVLGLLGYAAILILWGMGLRGPGALRGKALLGLWGGALFGVLFSIYLTFLEPFVIGATCAWCLTSAVIMTLILWAASPLAARVWPRSAE